MVAAVKRDLTEIAKRDRGLAKSGIAAAALRLAEALDEPKNSATSKAMCAKALAENLERLRELTPAEKENDKLDELSARRSKRIARSATA